MKHYAFTIHIKLKKIGRLIIIDLRNGEKYLRVENNDVAVLGDNN